MQSFTRKLIAPSPNLKKLTNIDHLNLLIALQHAYFTKLSSIPELTKHLHLYNGVQIFPPRRITTRKTTAQNIPPSKTHRRKISFGKFPQSKLPRMHFSHILPFPWGQLPRIHLSHFFELKVFFAWNVFNLIKWKSWLLGLKC